MKASWMLRVAAVGSAALAGMTAATGSANAEVVIGAGNATFGNVCVNNTSEEPATGVAADAAGLLSGNVAQVPVTHPRNGCGSQGLTGGLLSDRAAKTAITLVRW